MLYAHEKPKLNYIDSLRGIAIIMVILVHTSQSVTGLDTSTSLILYYCKTGVQLFFILSGFTLCLSMTQRHDGNLNFYIRRYFRIAPLYYLAILIYYIKTIHHLIPQFVKHPSQIVIFGHGSYTFFNVLCNVLFIHGVVPSANNGIVPGGWSIGTEMLFYLIFPFIFKLYTNIRDRKMYFIIPAISFIMSLIYSLLCQYVFKVNQFDLTNFYFYNIINQLPIFLLGISLFFSGINISKGYSFATFVVLFSISLILFIEMPNDISISNFTVGLSFVFLFIFFRNISKSNFSLLSRIGQLSFSIYIFHFLFAWPLSLYLDKILHVNPLLSLLICVISTLSLSCLVAHFSEKYIEKPGIKLGRSIIDKFKTRLEVV